jgi:putative DNA primase/helicase
MPASDYTLTEIESALAFIPADDRDLWVRMGMALHSEFPGADGREAFLTWSASAASFDKKAALATWRSFKPGGGIGIGTLIAEARSRGWRRDRPTTLSASRPAEAAARAASAQTEKDAAESQAAAANRAAELLAKAEQTGESAYLQRKGVRAYAVRFGADGVLLVPLADHTGAVHNVQLIKPDGTKRFLAGGRKSGLWHWTITPPPADAGVLLIAEGYATAASLTEATGYPCAVAFDCGNLSKVARSIRGAFPAARIVLCADDDSAKHSGARKNPGLAAAQAAAQAIQGRVAVPAPLAGQQTDFNDLAQSAGLEAVRICVEAALAEQSPSEANEALADGGNAESHDDKFGIEDGRLGYWKWDKDARNKLIRKFVPICPPLKVLARVRDSEKNGWGRLLQFRDPERALRTVVLPDSKLVADRGDWPALLADKGFEVPLDAGGKKLLAEYIRTRQIDALARTVQRIGWHGSAVFVLHDGRVVAADEAHAERFIYSTEGVQTHAQASGRLDLWRANVAALAVGNSRLCFSISAAFAGVLLEPYGLITGAGFHFFGDSGTGKSTCLIASASVWGGESYMLSWRSTDSSLEVICEQRSDTFLVLDEVKQIDAQALGQAVYMMGNGAGKARNHQGGANRQQRTWRIVWISSGELRCEDRVKEAAQKQSFYAGQETRMPDIPADAGAGMGVFESLHGHATPRDLAQAIKTAIRANHGHAGPAFVEWIVRNRDDLADHLRKKVDHVADAICPESAAEGVRRTAERFALVAVAGELATQAGLTGWPAGEAARAAGRCFNAWIEARGGTEAGEEIRALRHVQTVLRIGQNRFIKWTRALDDHAPGTPNPLGFVRLIGSSTGKVIDRDEHFVRETGDADGRFSESQAADTEQQFVVLPGAWKEICGQYNDERVRALLNERGFLVADKGRSTLAVRPPGYGSKSVRCVVVKAEFLGAEI